MSKSSHRRTIPRLAQLGIVASVQPVHAPSDMVMADRFLGSRAALSYAYHSLKATGVEMVFGSDAPVEPVNPFHGLHAAVTRRRLDGSPGEEGWQPQERLSLADALDGFSSAPARIANRGSQLGRIMPGAKADLILLKDDPFKMSPHEIGSIQPEATMINSDWFTSTRNVVSRFDTPKQYNEIDFSESAIILIVESPVRLSV